MAAEFEYDVALSFARDDQGLAQELAQLLTDQHITVFQDQYSPDEPWGNDLVNHLVNIYNRKAAFCVLLVSEHYPLRRWSRQDRLAAQERALRDADEYIVLLALDDTEVAGATDAPGYVNLRQHSLESIADLLKEKLAKMPRTSGPPTESHDLRSGNVSSAHSESDSPKPL